MGLTPCSQGLWEAPVRILDWIPSSSEPERFIWEKRDGAANSFAIRGESEALADCQPVVEIRIERTTKLLQKETQPARPIQLQLFQLRWRAASSRKQPTTSCSPPRTAVFPDGIQPLAPACCRDRSFKKPPDVRHHRPQGVGNRFEFGGSSSLPVESGGLTPAG
jgi:hypothetical protein